MALNTFGGGPNDVTVDAAGTTVGGVQLTVWTTKARTQQVTTLYAADGVTLLPGYVTSSTAAAPSRGRWSFKADSSYSVLWLWDGNPANDPWPVPAVEVLDAGLANRLAAEQARDEAQQAAADATTNSTQAINTANQASADASSALSTANATQAAQQSFESNAATRDELVFSFYMPGFSNSSSMVGNTASAVGQIMVAPFALEVTWVAIAWDYDSYAAGSTNYIAALFRRNVDNVTREDIVQLDSKAGYTARGKPLTSDPFPFTVRQFNAGDQLECWFQGFGTFLFQWPCTITVKYRPL